MEIGLDFETFSDVDIKKHGMHRYMESPDFTVLCAAAAFSDGSVVNYDFVREPTDLGSLRTQLRAAKQIDAHNASFERAVIGKLGWTDIDPNKIVDSAVVARAMGAGSKLELAAPQLLQQNKVDLGPGLIRVFSVPNKDNGGQPFSADAINNDPLLAKQWEDFLFYCGVDAQLSRQIVDEYGREIPAKEQRFEQITQRMNEAGWKVDLDVVYAMQAQYEINLQALEQEFQGKHDPQGKLNFRSYKQLQMWCAERGVNAKSFDQQALPKLKRALLARLDTLQHMPGPFDLAKAEGYREVLELIRIKQERGGSSLSKLQTIIDMTSADGRLRGQYLHVGAGQTYRTSGRGVQLQNLPRLGEMLGNVDELVRDDPAVWDNDELSENIRQVFEAEHPDGMLLVGDFKSVESRGLAFEAGEQWKLDAYRNNEDIYKRLAMTYQSNRGVAYEDVTKEQRQGGKVGELACGYGAGPAAVQGFAEKMGIDMTETESAQIVRDWRAANPEIVKLWKTLDSMMHTVLRGGQSARYWIPSGGYVEIQAIDTPASLLAQHPGAQSISMNVWDTSNSLYLTRVFHGCYYRGNDVNYYKPSELKNGELWRGRMTTPPHHWYKLYGGKLAGILTQSFCRELFMQSLSYLDRWARGVPNVKVIGQFHDEIVVEWTPPSGTISSNEWSLDACKEEMGRAMSESEPWRGFPLEADIKHAHRYIK